MADDGKSLNLISKLKKNLMKFLFDFFLFSRVIFSLPIFLLFFSFTFEFIYNLVGLRFVGGASNFQNQISSCDGILGDWKPRRGCIIAKEINKLFELLKRRKYFQAYGNRMLRSSGVSWSKLRIILEKINFQFIRLQMFVREIFQFSWIFFTMPMTVHWYDTFLYNLQMLQFSQQANLKVT